VPLCSKCGKHIESNGFKTCDSCREYNRRWRKLNHDHCIEYDQTIRVRHREREDTKESKRKYRQTHREKIADYLRGYRKIKREFDLIWCEREKERCRQRRVDNPYKAYAWQKANPEKRRVSNHNRRARINGNGGELPNDVEPLLFEQQEGFCYLCGKPLYARFNDPPTIEHKTPLSRGGSNDISNIALAHLSCNCRKGTKTLKEFSEL